MTDEEDCFELLLDPIAPLQDDEETKVDDDVVLVEDEELFLLLLDSSFWTLLDDSSLGSSYPMKLLAPGSRGLSRSPMS